jgi:hypothetical protein
MSLEITLIHHAGLGQQQCLSFAQANHVLGQWAGKIGNRAGANMVNFKVLDLSKGMAYAGEFSLRPQLQQQDLGAHLIDYFSWVCGNAKPAHCTVEEYRTELTQFSVAMKGRAAFYLGVVRDLVNTESTTW